MNLIGHCSVDNFDFQDMMHFIKGLLDNEEIMGHQIHAHRIDQHEFISHSLQSLHQLDVISCMFLQRLIYPIVPEKLDSKLVHLKFLSLGSYHHEWSSFDWGSSESTRSLLAKNSTVGSNCDIHFSIIGQQVRIGNNVALSMVWALVWAY